MKIEIPTTCPSCNSTLDRVNDQIFCRNTECAGVNSKKVLGFIKVMKIKGLGEKTVEKLDITDIHDIYTLDRDTCVDIIGEKLTDKILAEIDKSKISTVSMFLSSFSISLIGATAANKIKTRNIQDLSYDLLRKYGLGEKAAMNLSEWVINTYPYYEDLPISFKEVEEVQKLDDKYSVCITGKIPGYTKATISAELADLGVKVVNSVTKTTTHLICDETKGSAKEKKADSLNIPIVKFDKFKEIINV